jgi:hypothetical protein
MFLAAPAAWRGAAAATPPFARTTARAAASLRLPASPLTIGLDSPSFQTLRARRNAYVDKTSAIADLLVGDEGMRSQTRAFFARPRKFGKSLTLDVAAELLAAGALPAGVAPWAGRVPVDVDAVFGGLAVHARLRRRDPSLRGLLERAHFVVKLGLGGAQTGTKLEGTIISQIAGVAGSAFGGALEATVRSAVTPSDALEMVVRAVPASVPVSLLVDEYDGAIIQDVSRGRWAAADDGMAALRSLFMATKAPDVGARIERCLVTGVARFTRTSLFSGANNFADMTESPSLTRALGFSEVEIRAVFPAELARLASTLGTDVDGAIAELARWYNGYSFDGLNSSFNPFPVLAALRAGAISERELEAASGTNWLSLTPGAVIEGLAQELRADDCASMASVDVTDLEAQRVRAVPLLLQTGLLSIVAGQPAQCRAPNEYARRSLQRMVSTALATSPAMLAPFAAALRSRDRAAFSTAAMLLLERIPRALFKRDSCSGGDVGPREAVYHAALYAALVSTAPPGVCVQIQAASLRGQADVIIRFAGAPHPAAWVIEVGLGATPAAKLPQARDYARALDEPDVYVCALVVMPIPPASVASGGAAVIMEWTRRVSGTWEPA